MENIINLLPQSKYVCTLIEGAFGEGFCNEIISKKKATFKKANTHYPTSYRNNERQLVDDNELAEFIFNKVKNFVPAIIQSKTISMSEQGSWSLLRLNSRIRFCRYLPNQYFNKHLDGIHYESDEVQSKLTFMIYLNGQEDFEGGKTMFFKSKLSNEIVKSYSPKKGDLMIFDHNLWHSGEMVSYGEKYILRSDIMYKRVSKSIRSGNIDFKEGHLGYIWAVQKIKNKFITAGRDKKIKLWNEEGVLLYSEIAHNNSILGLLAFNENVFISASRDECIKFWNLKNNRFEEISKHKFHNGSVLSLSKVDETKFLSSGADGKINLINIEGELVLTIQSHNEWVWATEVLDQNIVISIGEDGLIKIWDLVNQILLAQWNGSDSQNSIAVVSKSKFWVGNGIGFIRLFEYDAHLNTINLVMEQKCHDGIIRKIIHTENSIISGGEDNKIRIWDKELNLIKEFKHKNFVQDITIDGNRIISVSYDGEIKRLS